MGVISLSFHKAKSLRKETCFQMGPFCQKGVFPVTAGLLLCVIPKGILDAANSLKWEQICAQPQLSPTSALPPSCPGLHLQQEGRGSLLPELPPAPHSKESLEGQAAEWKTGAQHSLL